MFCEENPRRPRSSRRNCSLIRSITEVPHVSWRECADTFFLFFSLPRLPHSLPRLSHSLPWFYCHIPLSNVCRQLLSDSTSQWTPLLLAIQFPLLGLVRDLHPLDNAHAERTNKEALSGLPYMESAVCVCMTGCWRIILCCPTARWFLCRKMIFGNSVSLIKSFSIYGSSTII